jgi:hypothetical protein
MIRVKAPQDLGAGLLFMFIGIAGVYFGKDLTYGSAVRMGPGFFPIWLSWIIIGIGTFLAVRSVVLEGDRIEPIQVRPLAGVIAAILVFGLLISAFGAPLSIIVLVFFAAFARPQPALFETLLLSIGLAIFAVIAFIYALGQPLPLWWDVDNMSYLGNRILSIFGLGA